MSGIGRGRGRSARPAGHGWLPSAMDATPAAVTFVPYGSGSASSMAGAIASDVDDRVPLLAAAQSTSTISTELAPASAPEREVAASTDPAPAAPAAASADSHGTGAAGEAAGHGAGAAGVGQLQPASAASAASPGVEPWFHVAATGDVDVLRAMLEGGRPVDSTNKEGLTALYIACNNGHEAAARLLLERGADSMLPCGEMGGLPIHAGAAGGHEPIVRLFLGRGVPVDVKTKRGATVLYIACQEGREAVVRLLLERGADPLLCDDYGWRPLQVAVVYEHMAIVKLLLERGVDPSLADSNNQLPIHAAAESGNIPLFKLFLELGNPVTATCTRFDIKGTTVLHVGAFRGFVDIIRLSLQHGAALEAIDGRGWTPLMVACQSGEAAAARSLLEAGAEWDTEDKEGVTALELALRWRQGALLNPFLDCPRVLFTSSKLADICGRIVDAVAAECNPAAVVAKFPAHKLHCALHLARLLERAAKANPDQTSLILEHRDEAIDVAYQLLDAMGRKFGERLQRRARNDGLAVTWIGAMRRLGMETEDKRLEERLRDCVELTADDPLDTWHAKQLYKRCYELEQNNKNSAIDAGILELFWTACDQLVPIADSVEALELCLPGVGSPLDIAIELDLYPFFGHPFVHRYIQRISESASDMQAASLLPSALVSLAEKLLLRGAEKDGKSEGKDGKSEDDAGTGEDDAGGNKQPIASEGTFNQTSEGELWWESPGHPLNSWKGKFAADLTTYLIFLFLTALAVWSVNAYVLGELGHGRPQPSVLALLAIQSLCMLLHEYYQARVEGFRDFLGDVFNLFDLALFITTPLLAIVGIIAEAVPGCAHYADYVVPVLSLIFIPASLRLLEFGYISSMLGPMLVVFGRMAQNVLSVLIVFLLVFASFVFALWGWSASILGRASDGEPPITLAETAGSLYFGFLGESDYDLMRSRVPIVGSAFFSIYQIITVILLLNVLTGLFSFSFTDIFENARHVYAFGRAKIILRYHRMGRHLVAPLNVVWLLLSPAPRLAAAVINVVSAVFFLPFLAVALGLSYLSRLVENLFGTPADKKKQQEAAAQSGALEAWLKAIETHRKARLADAAKEKTDAPLELKLKYPLAYDEANEKPDPVPPGPLKVAHTADNMPRNLETIHERTEKLEASQAELKEKLEEKMDASLAELKAGQAKLEASLAEVKAALAALAAPAARRSLFEF